MWSHVVVILIDFLALPHGEQSKQLRSRAFNDSRRLQEVEVSNGVYYFINLARRQDRRIKLEELLSSFSPQLWQRLERIDAIDGQSISLEDQAALENFVTADALQDAREKKGLATVEHHRGRFMRFNDHLTAGAVACAMSHHRALQAISNHPSAHWGLVLEDDIVATVPQVDRAIESLVARLPSDWDVVYLGYHTGRSLADGDGQNVLFHELGEPVWGLYAWIVSKKAAQKILDGAFPVDRQVDVAISSWVLEAQLRAFRVAHNSMLFYSLKSEQGLDSDIQNMREIPTAEYHNELMESMRDLMKQIWHVQAQDVGHEADMEQKAEAHIEMGQDADKVLRSDERAEANQQAEAKMEGLH
eukprot:gnl/MRDRNA2_/MRDRNA2_35189_c0_seq1.p1 gnl/MRDRNA2_/MRDRNA2_35189_c0~~gnl/MRDRNA2_/MRDRNA2_35189_c0_seq1.p1  ORF type:complete len:359 (-),score=65.40 gnl/MRDRNA2_/MRDRNA2_35189_c0_seq1:52-1128(-)